MLRHWAVSLARYVDRGEGGGGIELRKHESQHLDHRTKEFVRWACVARHQVPRKVGGMAPVSIDDSVNQVRQSLESYVQSSHEELLKTVRRERVEKQKMPSGFRAGRTEFRMAKKLWRPCNWGNVVLVEGKKGRNKLSSMQLRIQLTY